MLLGKKVLLGVTGSIAAYKAIQILRDLTGEGAEVQVVLTPAAHRFVSPLTLQIFSGRPVFTDLFDLHDKVIHLTLTQDADLVLIAPATADFIAKMAAGLADDLLTSLLLSASAPVVVAPAMDIGMWDHPTVQRNISILREWGIHVIEPETGPLASGKEGKGRLADERAIVEWIATYLKERDRLKGEVILVTAGPTQEPIDPVRFISNRSSGRMGYALAEAAHQWGAEVILISGPSGLSSPPGIRRISVRTAEEMKKETERHFPAASIVIMAAAVCDFRPKTASFQKIKKNNGLKSLAIEQTDDILQGLSAIKGKKLFVGFAAETENLTENARKKLYAKGLDLIVANDVTQAGAGFDTETNIVQLFDKKDKIISLPKMSKQLLAYRILDEVLRLKPSQEQR